ncbi:unnamed protein product [Prorocentrum cordatum]|uniref:Uncharacterized protein n=1 Tax=Prorocentrum cordatum TaxID=2364126 RepID=A0ABN9WEG5_9DINO|nr:unnamed protein product [Polarella glacialis]
MCLSLPPTGGRGRWGDDEERAMGRERERERELGGPTAPWACGRDGAESACGLLQAAKRACTVSFPGAVGDPRRREGGRRGGGGEGGGGGGGGGGRVA